MTILILSGTYPPDKCGVGDYTSKLYDALIKNNKQHDIYLMSSHKLLKNGEHNSLEYKPLKWNFFGIWRIIRAIKLINPDIINLQFPTKIYRFSVSVLFLVIRLKRLGFRIVTTLHEYSFSPKLAQFRSNFIIRSSNGLIVVDEQYKIDVVDRELCSEDRVQYIPVGSNIDRSELDAEGIRLVRSEYSAEHGTLIGYFGFIFPSKGVESLISLGRLLKQQKRLFKIVIVADLNSKNKYHLKILEMIRESGIDEELVVTGYLPANRIADLLKSMDVVVFPFTKGISTKNGSVLAALNQGVNVISTKSDRVKTSPYKLLHLIDHYSNIEQIKDIIDDYLRYDVDDKIITWGEIEKRTIDFLIDTSKS